MLERLTVEPDPDGMSPLGGTLHVFDEWDDDKIAEYAAANAPPAGTTHFYQVFLRPMKVGFLFELKFYRKK
jgi:hypothetical protein